MATMMGSAASRRQSGRYESPGEHLPIEGEGRYRLTWHREDFTPGQLLGSVSGELGLRKFLEAGGHTFTVTSDKDSPDSLFERELPTADVVISQPSWPTYLTQERIARAARFELATYGASACFPSVSRSTELRP